MTQPLTTVLKTALDLGEKIKGSCTSLRDHAGTERVSLHALTDLQTELLDAAAVIRPLAARDVSMPGGAIDWQGVASHPTGGLLDAPADIIARWTAADAAGQAVTQWIADLLAAGDRPLVWCDADTRRPIWATWSPAEVAPLLPLLDAVIAALTEA